MLRSLDDLEGIAKIDSHDMLGAVDNSAEFLVSSSILEDMSVPRQRGFRNLVLIGMGGSGSAADILYDWLGPRLGIPIVVIRDSALPRFVGEDTLVVAISYSGETMETLTAFDRATRRGSTLAGLGSGGRLAELCERSRAPFAKVPQDMVPRAALCLMVGAGALLLEGFGIVKGTRKELEDAAHELALLRRRISVKVPSFRNHAKKTAQSLRGKLPVIYCLQRMSSVARRAKNQFAENAKLFSKYDLLPEAGHNEVMSWQKRGNAVAVLVRDRRESVEERAVVDAFKETVTRMSGRRLLEIRGGSVSDLGRLLGPVVFLDYVSIYLACMLGVDPTPTQGINEYRRLLFPTRDRC